MPAIQEAQTLREQLAAAGMKPTSNLLDILEVLVGMDHGWLGGEDIYRRILSRGGSPPSLSTVYRLLKLLETHGVVLRMWREGGGGIARGMYRHRSTPAYAQRVRLRPAAQVDWVTVDNVAQRDLLLHALEQCGCCNTGRWVIEVGSTASDGSRESQC